MPTDEAVEALAERLHAEECMPDCPRGVTYGWRYLARQRLDPMLARPSGASISSDRLYRYELWRRWGPGDFMVFIMLNPSTANAYQDDPTIRRCMGFAMREGCGGISVVNLYALRATKPAHLLDHPDPEGPENASAVRRVLDFYHRGPIVAAWGASMPVLNGIRIPSFTFDNEIVTRNDLVCLGTTAAGHPRHPLYIKADQPLIPWVPNDG